MKRTYILLIAIAVILGWPKAFAQTVTILPPDAQIQSALAFERGIMPMLKVKAVLDGADRASIMLVLQLHDSFWLWGLSGDDDFVQVFRAKGESYTIPSYFVQFLGSGYNRFGVSGPIHLNQGTNEIVFSGEFAADLDKYAGMACSISVVGVSVNAAFSSENVSLNGSFPITGRAMTISSTFEIGSFDLVPTNQESRNVAAGAHNQVIGVFDASVSGEACATVHIPDFKIEAPGNKVKYITNVSLTDENNVVIAGPVDVWPGEKIESSVGLISFNDSIIFPKGGGRYYVKAKIGSDFTNGTITVNTVPNEWYLNGLMYNYGFRGKTTSAVSGGTSTVRTGQLSVSAVLIEPDQAVFGGSRQTIGLQIMLDATESSESVREITIPIGLAVTNGVATDITNVTLYDGTTPITTGSNVLDPTSQGVHTLTLDGAGFIVQAGTSKTITLRFDLSTSASGSIRWSLPDPGNTHAAGVLTGSSIDPVLVGDGLGPVRTVFTEGGDSFTVKMSSASPSFQKVPPGAQAVTFTKLRVDNLRPEDIQLRQLPLELNSSLDHYTDIANSMFGVWHGSRRVGETFIMNQRGVATLTLPVIIPSNGYVDLTIKGDIDEASPNGGAVIGNVLKVVFDGDLAGLDGTYATGMETGMNVTSLSPDTTGFGVEIVDPKIGPRVTSFTGEIASDGQGKIFIARIKATGSRDETTIVQISNDLKSWTDATVSRFQAGELYEVLVIGENDPRWHIVRDGIMFARLKAGQ